MKEEELAVVTMNADHAGDDTAGRGTMVIRIWSEANADQPFRSRLTFGRTGTGQPREALAASHEQILETVRKWLEDFPE